MCLGGVRVQVGQQLQLPFQQGALFAEKDVTDGHGIETVQPVAFPFVLAFEGEPQEWGAIGQISPEAAVGIELQLWLQLDAGMLHLQYAHQRRFGGSGEEVLEVRCGRVVQSGRVGSRAVHRTSVIFSTRRLIPVRSRIGGIAAAKRRKVAREITAGPVGRGHLCPLIVCASSNNCCQADGESY